MSFLSNQNINLLWEVLLDEPSIQCLNSKDKSVFYNTFRMNIINFYQNEEKNNTDMTELISLNKKCLSQMIRIIKNNTNTITTSSNINTNNSTNNVLYKVQDIQAQRQQLFEQQLAQKKNDFDLSMTLTKPPVPNFTEKIEDEKIKGMEELIARTVAQRNFEISQINNTQQNFITPNKIKIKEELSNNIIQNNVVELKNKLTNTKIKKLSWDDNQTQYFDNTGIVEQDINFLHKISSFNLEPDHNRGSVNEYVPEENNISILSKLCNENTELKERINIIEGKLDLILTTMNNLVEIINNNIKTI